MAYSDGTFTSPTRIGPRKISYPLIGGQSPDVYCRQTEREYMTATDGYSPTISSRQSITNYLLQSSTFGTTWSATNITVTSNSTANPEDGTVTADSFVETAATGFHVLTQAYTATATAHTNSVYAKANGRNWVVVDYYDSAFVNHYAFFDLSNGVVGTTSNVTSTLINNVGNGWYRCSVTFTPASGGGYANIYASSDGALFSYAGDTSKGFILWGAQMERASSAGPLVQTTTGTVTASVPYTDSSQNYIAASDPLAYLISETDYGIHSSGDYMAFRRLYSRIPGQQTMYSSRTFARPNFSGMKSGSTYAASLDEGRSVHLWTSRKPVQSVSSSQGATISNTLPSGTITITLSDATTSTFNANASKATIDAALASIVGTYPNKLASAYAAVSGDGSTTTVWYGTWVGGPSVSSVTGPSTVEITQLTGQITYRAVGTTITPDTKTMKCDSHGASAGSRCAIWNGSTLAAVGQVSGVGDANSLTLVMSDLSSPEVNITHLTFDVGATYRYNLEPAEVMTREVWDFYLPGVSTGITTGADVAMPTIYQSAQAFFDRIVAADTYTAIAASLDQWQGPILVRKTISVKMSSALQSMALT